MVENKSVAGGSIGAAYAAKAPAAGNTLFIGSASTHAINPFAAEVKRLWELPMVVTAIRNVGGEPAPSSPDEFTEYTKAERARWGKVVKAAGVRLD